ncbi:MAG: DUF4157 domain-containing protein [Saonia sp.]
MAERQSKIENSSSATVPEITHQGNPEAIKKRIDPGFRNLPIQRKLSIGAVDDPLEHEADAVADMVMRMPAQTFIQRKCSACEEEDRINRKPLASFIQKKGTQGGMLASESVSNRINDSRGNGHALPGSTKNFMETHFGTDFSGVKIHTGEESTQMSQELGAKAFTVGNDIYFNSGQYAPGTTEGNRLLAHELAHTVQQANTFSIRRQALVPQRSAEQQIATTLRNAASGWGTDESAIFNALTGRTTVEITAIEAAYLSLSGGETLETMLRDELSGNDLSRALSLLRGETPSTEIARTLWNAMRGWGTDESAIYAAIAGRTAAQWTAIQGAYRQMTGSNLLTEIRDELTDDEWTYLQTLLPGAVGGAVTDEDRATVIANQLEAAMQGWGTDESAIYAALTGHTEAELREIERRYRLITGRELHIDLRDELTDREYERAQNLLHPLGLPEKIARSLHKAVDGLGTREAEIIAILQGRSSAEITQISTAYLRLYHESLNERLEDELGGSDWLETSILLSGRVPNVLEEVLISTMGRGTDEERLLAALDSLGMDLTLISLLKQEYLARTGHRLRTVLISELSRSDLTRALLLIRDNPLEETANEMTSLVGARAAWTPSGPTGSVGATSGNDFADWASAASESTAPEVLPSTTINCWEMVLLSAYRAGVLSWNWIHNLYVNVQMSDWPDTMSSSRTPYSPGDLITRGYLVFFDGVAHVALATGNPDEVLTFWPPPDFAPDAYTWGTVDEVKIRSLSSLITYMGAPAVEYGAPSW